MDFEALAKQASGGQDFSDLAAEAAYDTPERQAERERMIAIANARMQRNMTGEVPLEAPGVVYDPRKDDYTTRYDLTQGYEPTRTDAAMGGGMQGLGLNFGDEAVGALGSLVEGPEYGPLRREQMRGRLEAQQEAFPWLFGGSEIGGNVATAAASLPAATGKTLLGAMGRGAVIGAAEGAAYGAGDGENLEERLRNARDYGAVGGTIGFGAPVATAGAGKLYNAGKDMVVGGVDAMTNRTNYGRARRVIDKTLRNSGKSADDVTRQVTQAAAQGQPEYRLMDAMGIAGQRRASGIARKGGVPGEEIAAYLNQRQTDAKDRMGGFIEDAFDFRGKAGTGTDLVPEGYEFTDQVGDVLNMPKSSAADLTQRLTGARKSTADKAYDAAREAAGPVDVRGAVAAIDRRIGPMQGSNIKGDGIDAKLSGFRDRLIAKPAPDGEISRELSDFDRVLNVKQDVQDAADAAARAGRNNEATQLGRLAKELDAALETSSEAYRSANDGFRDASRVIDSVDRGAGMAKRGRAADNVPAFNAMNPQQQTAARVGYGDSLLEELERNRARAPDASRVVTSSKRQAESQAMAKNPALFADRTAREGQMYETFNRALGNSRTADNMEDVADLGPLADVARAGRDAASANFGQAISTAFNAVAPYLTGQNEATRKEIARILMSSDPKAALAPVLKQSQQSPTKRAMIDALIRSAAREPAYSASLPR